MIRKEGTKYVLKTSDGKRVLGTHPTKRAAMMQEVAIKKNQPKKK
jgi:hypothetical protein